MTTNKYIYSMRNRTTDFKNSSWEEKKRMHRFRTMQNATCWSVTNNLRVKIQPTKVCVVCTISTFPTAWDKNFSKFSSVFCVIVNNFSLAFYLPFNKFSFANFKYDNWFWMWIDSKWKTSRRTFGFGVPIKLSVWMWISFRPCKFIAVTFVLFSFSNGGKNMLSLQLKLE